MTKGAWVVRAGNYNEIVEDVEAKSVVAIGWAKMGNLSQLKSREQIKNRYREIDEGASEAKIGMNSGQLYRFAQEIKVGDFILTPIQATREILIGTIVSEYEFNPSLISEHYPHIRKVKWTKDKVSRDQLTAPFKNTMGSLMTVFSVADFISDIETLLVGGAPPVPPEEGGEGRPTFWEEVKARADELISDLVSDIDPYDFQDLVAGVLQAMGFRTRVSAPGPDGAVDVVAHPDAFGFQEPRIKVQVKHRKGKAGADEVRSFMATVNEGENGLYISTGGFTPEALRQPDRSRRQITLLDRHQFIDLLLENYDSLDPRFKAMIPLARVYIPTEARA